MPALSAPQRRVLEALAAGAAYVTGRYTTDRYYHRPRGTAPRIDVSARTHNALIHRGYIEASTRTEAIVIYTLSDAGRRALLGAEA